MRVNILLHRDHHLIVSKSVLLENLECVRKREALDPPSGRGDGLPAFQMGKWNISALWNLITDVAEERNLFARILFQVHYD